MMKRHFMILLPVLAIACSSGEEPAETTDANATDTTEVVALERSDLLNRHLMGDVKTIEETPYMAAEDGAMGDMDSCCIEIIEFDNKGFLQKITEKNSEGEVTAVTVQEYDADGLFISRTRSVNGQEVWKRTVTRDDEGNGVMAYDTDADQQMTDYYIVDERNDFGQAVKGKSFSPDSTFVGTWSWKYIDGLRSGRGWADSSGKQLIDVTGEVNDKGWLAKSTDTRVNEEGETVTTVMTYTYDSFDDMGNWTQRTESENGVPVQILKRTYTYY